MFEKILKKLHIKTKPDKIISIFLYIISVIISFIFLIKIVSYIFGDARIVNNISPYLFSLIFVIPVLAFCYYVNAGIAKNDDSKIKIYMFTLIFLGIYVATMFASWVNISFWYIIEKIPNYAKVMSVYPELFSPAVKTLSFSVTFVFMFKLVDYFLLILRDDDLIKTIGGFTGLTTKKTEKIDSAFTCSTIICKNKGTNAPVFVPEKKRYEATLVQGATGTGKTATVLLPMSALDLERKYFFREFSKKLGYSLLKKGVAFVVGPYDNEYMNKNFTMEFIKPKRGMEEQFKTQVKDIIQFEDNVTGKIQYKNLGITVVENDGDYISKFVAVAKNFDIPVYSIDPEDIENTLSINPFSLPDPAKVASIIADVIKSMYNSEGGGGAGDPFFTQVTLDAFQNLAILLKEMHPILNNGELASLEDMLTLLYDFDKVEYMTEEMKKIPELEQKYKLLIAYFERNFYKPSLNINGFEIPGTRGSGRKDTERFLYGAITQLNNLLRHPGLKKALCGKTNIVEFDKVLEEGHIITACSRKGELGMIQSKAFGMFFILQFQDAVLRRKGNEDSRIPHFLYIDEFPDYINKDMEVIFTLFRKYRCGVTIAIQNLSQLEKTGNSYYRQVVLANTKTQIIFGDTVPEDSAYWEKAFGKEKVPDETKAYKLNKETGEFDRTLTIDIKKKERAEAHKIAAQGFGAVFYKTKDASGKVIFGKGKTSFLADVYKQKHDVAQFNFEKYMVSKPDNPSITINNSDSNNDDQLFGTHTTSKLNQELKSNYEHIRKQEEKEVYANNAEINNNVEIEFETLETHIDNAKIDGGAITETYETPAIRKN
ncbi:MAG: type IV secretory system conjugative DNA transfer family protein [Clostridia bacterium]